MVKKKYITFHYENNLLSKYIVRDETELLNKGNELILQGLRKNHSLQSIINVMTGYVKLFNHRRINKLKVSRDDHIQFVGCFLGLIKLKKLHENSSTGIIITKYKKLKVS